MRALARYVPFGLYALLAVLVGTWIVDDAGISYAYARNLAHGYGFVSQPGVPPVEGFSNFLWVVLLAPLLLVRAFDPVYVPKMLSAVLVFFALRIVQRTVERESGSAITGGVAAAAIAISPPVVIWTMSGLENALTLLLAAAYAQCLIERPRHWGTQSGVLAALLAMTHPELILLFGTGFVVSLASLRSEPPKPVLFSGTFALLAGGFFAYRLATFGLPLPHTYYAKRKTMTALERLSQMVQAPQTEVWDRLVALAQGHGGAVGIAVFAGLAAAAVVLAIRRGIGRGVAVWTLLALNAIVAYLWMDDDWMGEFRFATVVVLAVFAATALAFDALLRQFSVKRWAGAGLAAIALALAGTNSVARVRAFAANPTTPYADVSRRTAGQFTAYAEALKIRQPSILAADIGATLYESRLRVYDLAGLSEPDLVHTLKEDTQYWLFEHPKFYDWVFERIKPTFITSEKFWTYVAAFEKDPRFRRDYVAINTFPDLYVQKVFRASMRSGDFVRRDALGTVADVERMRQAYQPELRPDMTVESNAPPASVATTARALDGAGRPHDARGLWRRVADAGPSPDGGAVFLEALDRLGDSRQISRAGDALDAEMAIGIRQLYTERQLEQALATFDQILLANPSHYGAQFQRARTLTLLGRRDQARPAWQTVALLAARLSDQSTVATAAAELQK